MITCTIVAALVHCLNLPVTRPEAQRAVHVLTSSIAAYVAPPVHEQQVSVNVPYDARWPFLTPATPIRPLSRPWSVTTVVGRNYLETFFNGQSFTVPALHARSFSGRRAGRETWDGRQENRPARRR